MMSGKATCWAIEAGPGRRAGWEVALPSPVAPGELEITHFFGPRARERAYTYAGLTAPTETTEQWNIRHTGHAAPGYRWNPATRTWDAVK